MVCYLETRKWTLPLKGSSGFVSSAVPKRSRQQEKKCRSKTLQVLYPACMVSSAQTWTNDEQMEKASKEWTSEPLNNKAQWFSIANVLQMWVTHTFTDQIRKNPQARPSWQRTLWWNKQLCMCASHLVHLQWSADYNPMETTSSSFLRQHIQRLTPHILSSWTTSSKSCPQMH